MVLAQIYEADRASADWRHLGRLVGFTNRKPQRRRADALAPWVKLIHARTCLARDGAALRERAAAELAEHRGHSAPVRTALPEYSLSTTGLASTAGSIAESVGRKFGDS